MSKIVDYKIKVQNVYDELVKLNNDSSYSWEYAEDVNNRINQETVTIMFYGVYNAGKSTLLNAILGEKVASVADIPETFEVTPYMWNGYELYDTPGINGPEKDYILSKAELIKHDIILFLVDDSDSFDNRLVSNEIVQIIEQGKPLILIMNNKQTLDGDSDEDGISKRGKLFQNIEQAAENLGLINVLDKLDFMMIDADAALRARLENKNLLIQASRVEELEYLILQKLKEQSGFKFLIPPIQMMEQHFQSLNAHLNEKLASNEEQQLNNLVSDLRERKVTVIQSVKSKVNAKLLITKSNVFNKLLQEQLVEDELERCNQEIQELLKEEIGQVIEEAEVEVSRFALHIDSSNDSRERVSNISHVNSASNLGGATSEITEKLLENQMIATGIKGILAKKIIIPTIANPVPVMNIILIVKTVMDVISIVNKRKKEMEQLGHQAEAANEAQKEQVYQRTQAIQQLKSQLDAEFFKIEEQVVSQIDQVTNDVFMQYISRIEKELHIKEADSERNYKILKAINDLQQELSNVKLQITL